MKQKTGMALLLSVVLALTGCGAQNAAAPTASSVAEKTVETVAVDPTGQPENKEVVCEAQQRDYTLQVIRENGKKITDELSSYHDLYEGSYTVEVKKGDDICEDYKFVFDKDKTLYFPEFHVQNKTIVYHAYDQDLEKTVEKKKKFE